MLLNYYVVRIYVAASSCLELRSFLACKRLSTLKSFGLLPMAVDLYECKHQLIFCMLLKHNVMKSLQCNNIFLQITGQLKSRESEQYLLPSY